MNVDIKKIETRIKKKHRGGINNSKGADYENFYETYKIVTLLNDWINQQIDAQFQAQKECLVDDFWIKQVNLENKINVDYYYQLKNQKDLSWTDDLHFDFYNQGLLCQQNKENYILNLVYSDEDSPITSIPKDLQKDTKIEFFPYIEHLNTLVMQNEEFQRVLQNICSEDDATLDVLSDIASAVLAEWCKGEKNKLCNISEFEKLIATPKYVKLKDGDPIVISEVAMNLLNKFEIKWWTSSKSLNWSWHDNKIQGSIIWNKEKEEKLLSKEYQDVFELIQNLI